MSKRGAPGASGSLAQIQVLQAELQRGLALHQQNRLAEAERIYRAILDRWPKNFDALHLLGVLAHQCGANEQAVEFLTKAVSVNPSSAQAHVNRANVLKALNRVEDALASFDKALKITRDPATYYLRGTLLAETQRFEEAAEAFTKAISLKPDFSEAYSNLANCMVALERPGEALKSFDRALAIKPDADDYYNRGIALEKLGRFEEAINSYDKAIMAKPRFAEAYANRGKALKESGQFARALDSLNEAIAIDPNSADAFYNRGIVLNELDKFDAARLSYERAIALRSDFIAAYHNLGLLLTKLGDFEGAKASLLAALSIDPRDTLAYFHLSGSQKFIKGDPAINAMETLRTSGLSAEERMYLDFALGKAYADLKDHEKSFSHFVSGATAKRATISYDENLEFERFDRIESVFTRSLIAENRAAGNPSTKPIFILGMPRSGTTLVEQILASHPLVYGAGELYALDRAIGRVRLEQRIVDEYPQFMAAIGSSTLTQLGEKYLELVSELSPPEALHVTDKMPANFFFVGLIHLALPNAKIIHTRRDPVDTCISCFSKLFTEGQGFTYDLGELGRYYKRYERLMAHWHDVMPSNQILDVDYEAVVSDLEGEARRILSFCNLPWDDKCLSFHETVRPVRTASMTQVRQPIYSTSVGRRRHIEEYLKPLLEALGESASQK